MKNIIALSGASSKGKTQSLRSFADILIENFPQSSVLFSSKTDLSPKTDFQLVCKIAGNTIGIHSQGDPNQNLEQRITGLSLKYGCDTIICACRTKGSTVAATNKLARSNAAQIIWTSTYESSDKKMHDSLNKLKSQHLIQLLQILNLVP